MPFTDNRLPQTAGAIRPAGEAFPPTRTAALEEPAAIEVKAETTAGSPPAAGVDFYIKLFLAATILNSALACGLFLYIQYLFVDSVARTIHAFYVLWGNNAPHLAAIGFVWMPLPTIVQLPLVVWKPMAQTALAGGISSAICMALAITILDAFLRELGTGKWTRWGLLAAVQLNPMVLMYAANGMSEAMLVCILVAACHLFYLWSKTRRSAYIVLLGICAACAVMARYEGFAVVAAGAVGVVLVGLISCGSRTRMWGELMAYLAPPLYAVLMWMHFNGTIMGDHLYFFRGPYSNVAQIAFIPKELNVLTGNPLLTTAYVVQRVVEMAPIYLPVTLLVAALALIALDGGTIAILMLPASLLAFGWLNQLQGQSYGWFRFFIYAAPGAAISIALLLRSPSISESSRRWLAPVLVTAAILGNVVTFQGMLDPTVGREEVPAMKAILSGTPQTEQYALENRVVKYLHEHVGKRSVLLDDFSGREIIRLAGGTEMFVAGVDPDFRDKLLGPVGKVEYILVPRPEGLGSLDAVNSTYPELYDGTSPLVSLVEDWGEWRLFHINSQ